MRDNLDLERVINDPDYRRKAIEELNRAEDLPDDGNERMRQGELRAEAEMTRSLGRPPAFLARQGFGPLIT